ncbi:unnamed protein product [Spirodela intermedia]|uniref:Uncharacterized protein n=1 Tax=Spirodela intermedia TaxID=51605 RepID=A0A7I8JSL3_SPIIN|nr:unnamed protein product [Spirodela intermedia]CAA6672573.1 unnamed protein product [Spirodela intermedia]
MSKHTNNQFKIKSVFFSCCGNMFLRLQTEKSDVKSHRGIMSSQQIKKSPRKKYY